MRGKRLSQTLVNQASSPAPVGSQDEPDITLSEMSRRMLKRSLQVCGDLSQSESNEPISADSKRPKKFLHSDNSSVTFDELSSRTVILRAPDSTSFQAPSQSSSSDNLTEIVSRTDMEPLSPLPVARRILSRTSSRNLKENANIPRNLASPFSSRPGSRTGSPVRQRHRQFQAALKSQTLSSNIPKPPNKSLLSCIPADKLGLPVASATTPSSPVSQIPSTSKSQAILHSRTSSIPTIPTSSFGLLSDASWLVPPKILNRSPEEFREEIEVLHSGDPFFFFGVPDQVSTPAQKADIIIPNHSFATGTYSDDSDAYMSDTSDNLGLDVVAAAKALIPPASHRQPRRRRRTIMHVSSDSIFSSPLDFSAYITDEDSPGRIRRTTNNGNATQVPKRTTLAQSPSLFMNSHSLEPAFSPHPVKLVSEAGDATYLVHSLKQGAAGDLDLDDGNLGDMFSGLDLDGMSLKAVLSSFLDALRTTWDG